MENFRFTLRASVHILFLKDGKILLSLRKNVSSSGLWGLVAGHLDGKETVTQAMIREVKEEIGVKVNPKDLEIATVCHSYSSHNDQEFIQFYAICKKWPGAIINGEPDKCGELKFFPINSLPENMVPYIRNAILEILNGTKFYEYGWLNEQ